MLLNVVSTPIGNLKDISFRAVEVLKESAVIACEDTRVSKKLLQAYNISIAHKKIVIYNDKSNQKDRDLILSLIQEFGAASLISDAGTPLISDPGYKLIQHLRANGVEINHIPGPCAPISALILSGMPSDRFIFMGFLKNKPLSALNQITESLEYKNATLIFFEGASRILQTAELLKNNFPSLEICIVREMTKIYQEVICASAQEVYNQISNHPNLKGEFVLLINNRNFSAPQEDIETFVNNMRAKNIKTKEISKAISQKYAINSQDAYKLALGQKLT